ncbi:MAG TPA: glycosyl hydrolase [Kineosporiaceae bacterium]|nr:glycosyl hydrolase [Kineosporiaceae bacterium]
MNSSPPSKGGRRARLAAERQAAATSAEGAEVLDSRPSRRAGNRSQAVPAEPQRSAEVTVIGSTSVLPPAAPQAPYPSLFIPPSEAFGPPSEAFTRPGEALTVPGQEFSLSRNAEQPSPAASEPTSAELFAGAPVPTGRSRTGQDQGQPAGGRRSGSSGPNTTELGIIRGRRSARPQTKRRRAELALGRMFSDRRVWGGAIAATLALVALVPGLAMLQDKVTVADGGLSGTSSTRTTGDQSADSTRLAQPDVPDATQTETTGSPTAWAQAVVKATVGKAAAAATGSDKADKAGDPTGTGKTKDPDAKTPLKTPVSGNTDQVDSDRSGMAWPSGVYAAGHGTAGVNAFGDWRGAPVDVVIDWPARASWNDIINPTYLYGVWKNTSYTKVFGVPPIPEGAGASMAECAAGAYDDKWRQFGTNFKAAGLGGTTVIRLGWEFNGDWYIWNARNPDQFAECWRHVVSSAEETAPELLWDWNPNRGEGGSIVVDATKAWPGDSYVDYVGVDSYDMYPGVKTEADWAKHYSGAFGLKFWSDFARSHGKKLSVPEWAVYPGTASAGHNGGDNPFYVAKMHEFFKDQGSHLGYESYFNESSSYVAAAIFSPEQNSLAAAKYKALFNR